MARAPDSIVIRPARTADAAVAVRVILACNGRVLRQRVSTGVPLRPGARRPAARQPPPTKAAVPLGSSPSRPHRPCCGLRRNCFYRANAEVRSGGLRAPLRPERCPARLQAGAPPPARFRALQASRGPELEMLADSVGATARGPRVNVPAGSGGSVRVGDQAGLDEQLAARLDHPGRAVGHPHLAVWGSGGRVDLELAVDPADLRVELERDRLAAG